MLRMGSTMSEKLSENQTASPAAFEDVAASPAFMLRRTQSIASAKLENASLLTDTVVKIHGTGVRPSYLCPWQVKGQEEWTGSGFLIKGQRIITNAHVVMDATVLQVTKQEDPKKFRAQAVCVAHDLDLAIMKVEDPAFWEDLPCAEFSDEFPELYSEVKAVGFPTGGSTVCVTKGVVSRIDAQVYVHPMICGIQEGARNSPGSVMILQIDAAINPGNSGGPAFDCQGRVVGVASSGLPNQQNVGYIIPALIASMFLDEFAATGKWSGISEMGLMGNALENESMRKFLNMGSESGFLVTDVAPMGRLCGLVKVGDVVTHIDDRNVTNEGRVPLKVSGQVVYVACESLITGKAKGEQTTLRILRDGTVETVSVALAPIPPLTPRFHGFDCWPEYVMVGGIVFTKGSVPLHAEYLGGRRSSNRFISDSVLWNHFDEFKKDADHEVVILLTILKHDVNIGYGSEFVGVLDTFNDKKVRNLREFARTVGTVMKEEKEEFLRFMMVDEGSKSKSEKGRRPDIVLARVQISEADAVICAMNQIPAVASPGLLPLIEVQDTSCPATE